MVRLALVVERPTDAEGLMHDLGHVARMILLGLAAWTLTSVIVAVIVGRIIAAGQRSPVTERLAEVEADREQDEALFV